MCVCVCVCVCVKTTKIPKFYYDGSKIIKIKKGIGDQLADRFRSSLNRVKSRKISLKKQQQQQQQQQQKKWEIFWTQKKILY